MMPPAGSKADRSCIPKDDTSPSAFLQCAEHASPWSLPPNHRRTGSAKASLRTPALHSRQSASAVHCAAHSVRRDAAQHHLPFHGHGLPDPSGKRHEWDAAETETACWCRCCQTCLGPLKDRIAGAHNSRPKLHRFRVQAEMRIVPSTGET
jgi:hypothetical protein